MKGYNIAEKKSFTGVLMWNSHHHKIGFFYHSNIFKYFGASSTFYFSIYLVYPHTCELKFREFLYE